MVLIVAILSLWLFNNNDDSLFNKHQKDVESKALKFFDKQQLTFKNSPCSFGELKEVIANNENIGYVYVNAVSACSLSGCAIPTVNKKSGVEYFDLMVFFNTETEILNVTVLNYFSDYGYEITSKRYLKKFEGKQICDFTHEIDGIDGISGATISCNALESELKMLCSNFY